jgi:hypothetical protein
MLVGAGEIAHIFLSSAIGLYLNEATADAYDSSESSGSKN